MVEAKPGREQRGRQWGLADHRCQIRPIASQYLLQFTALNGDSDAAPIKLGPIVGGLKLQERKG